MKQLAQHLACLRELDADRRRSSRASVLGFVAAAALTTLALAAVHYLEQVALDRIGLR